MLGAMQQQATRRMAAVCAGRGLEHSLSRMSCGGQRGWPTCFIELEFVSYDAEPCSCCICRVYSLPHDLLTRPSSGRLIVVTLST